MTGCPTHPELGLACESERPDHTMCTAATPQTTTPQETFHSSWVRVWWRDGRPWRHTRNLQGSP